MSNSSEKILEGVNEVIDRHLFAGEELPHYRYFQKRSCNKLSKSPPKSFDGAALVAGMYQCIEGNLAKRPDGRTPSSKNWNLRSTKDHHLISPSSNNESAEVKLERAIVQNWPDSWTYQMPVASGLFDGHSDKRRAVDLVFDHKDGHFDLVELKIKSDTPLYAAMEILGYGLIYLASRTDRAKNLKYKAVDLPVLSASGITLCVLTPEGYYAGSHLMWLQDEINDGLKRLATLDLRIDFRFEQFGSEWSHVLPINGLTETLIRKPVWQ